MGVRGSRLGARGQFAEGWSVWGNIGYALAPYDETLLLHTVPLTVGAEVVVGDQTSLAFGAHLQAQPKWAFSTAANDLHMGLKAGPHVRATFPTAYERLNLHAQLAGDLRLLRQRYHLDDDDLEEDLWEIPITVGVEWQWM